MGFGFNVYYDAPYAPDEGYGHGGGFRVILPHQCDGWVITGSWDEPSPREVAIADLEEFIAEAQEALERLRVMPEVEE